MKKIFSALCVSAAMFFAACGDDSGNSANSATDKDEVSSSSIECDDEEDCDEDADDVDSSSSSEKSGSSSSKKGDSDSSDGEDSSSSAEEESSGSEDPGSVYDSTANTLTDLRDGQVYRTTKIGSQVWMAENLNFETREGKSYCYDRDTLNCKKFGRLYTWAALMDTLITGYGYYKYGHTNRGVCPMDWHVPTTKEWEVLLKKCNYSSKGALFANSPEWIMDNEEDEFTDECGFSALPGGEWDGTELPFEASKKIGEYVYFWTQSEVLNQGEREKTRQAYMVFGDNYGQLFMDSMYHTYKHFGLSVRCLKD